MKYYIKVFKDIYEDEQNPLTLVWRKGEYYEIYNEPDDRIYNRIFCDNEYMRKIADKDTETYLAKAWVAIKGIEKVKGRLPLNFIKLSEEEVNAEKEKSNVREN